MAGTTVADTVLIVEMHEAANFGGSFVRTSIDSVGLAQES